MPALDQGEISLRCWKMYGGNHRAHHPVSLPGLEEVLYSAPCGAPAGGDLYYLSACGSGVTARACLADAAGHGKHSAEVGAWFEEIFHKHIHRMSPSVVLRDVNARAAVRGNFQAVATALCISYNALNGQLRFSNAGHPLALVFREEPWETETLDLDKSAGNDPRNLPLGVMESAHYDIGSTRLMPRDRILLYTDGVSETPDECGAHLGQDKLRQCFLETAHLSVAEQTDRLIASLSGHAGEGVNRHDDVTLLLLEAQEYMSGNRFYHLIRNNLFKSEP